MTSKLALAVTVFADLSRHVEATDSNPIYTCVTATIPTTDSGEDILTTEDLSQWQASLEEYKEGINTRLIALVQKHKKLRNSWSDANLEELRKAMTAECQGATLINGVTSTAPNVTLMQGTEGDAEKYQSDQGASVTSWKSLFSKGKTVVSV